MQGPTRFNLLSKKKQDDEIRLNFKELTDMMPENVCSLQKWFKKEEEEWRIRFDDFEYSLDENDEVVWEDDMIYLDRTLNKEGIRKESKKNQKLKEEVNKIMKIMKMKTINIYPMLKVTTGKMNVEIEFSHGLFLTEPEGDEWITEIKKMGEEIGYPIDLKEIELIAVFDEIAARKGVNKAVSDWKNNLKGSFPELEKLLDQKFKEYENQIEKWIKKEKGFEIIRESLIENEYYVYP